MKKSLKDASLASLGLVKIILPKHQLIIGQLRTDTRLKEKDKEEEDKEEEDKEE